MQESIPRQSEASQTSTAYIVIVCLIVLVGGVVAVAFPFKTYRLNLGDFGSIRMRVGRFNGAREMQLRRSWIQVLGSPLPETEKNEINLDFEPLAAKADGYPVRVHIHNPTEWRVTALVIGYLDSRSNKLLVLTKCDVAPFSGGTAEVNLPKDADAKSAKRLLAIGTPNE